MKLKKIKKIEPVPEIPPAETPVPAAPVSVPPAVVETQAPVETPQPTEESEEDWSLEEIATQTQQVFHNKKTDETLSLYEAILKILNAI